MAGFTPRPPWYRSRWPGAAGGACTGSFELLSPELAHARGGSSRVGPSLTAPWSPTPATSTGSTACGRRRASGSSPSSTGPAAGRRQAILDEHPFLLDCAVSEIPVIAPLRGLDGQTLHERARPRRDGSQDVPLRGVPPDRAAAPSSRNRTRISSGSGALLGRCHAVGARRDAPARSVCSARAPHRGVRRGAALRRAGASRPRRAICRRHAAGPSRRSRRFSTGVPFQRIHGDCHRATSSTGRARVLR